MSVMVFARARFAVGIASGSLLAALAGPARADSFPSGWTGDDAPAQQQPPAPQAPAARQVQQPQPAPADPGTGWTDDPGTDAPPAARPSPGAAPNADAYSDTDPSALSDFQAPLAGHGQWVDDPQYGRIWVPDEAEVGSDFAPYQTAGHWSLDDGNEWLWVSDYDWGYVPFHYGRWLWVPGTGWGWIPGRVYAPAWVSWRVGPGGYIGWGPRAPAYGWRRGRAFAFGGHRVGAYCFVPGGRVFAHDLGSHIVRTPAAVRTAAASTRSYTPAHPTSSGGGGGHRMSPTPEEAHVSASAAAQAHAHADARAAAFARPSTTSAARAHAAAHASAAGHFSMHGAYGHGAYGHGAYDHGATRHGSDAVWRSHARAVAAGHAYSHGSPTLHTPRRSTGNSGASSSSSSHTRASGARSSGHGSSHHR